jgi:hypothetical protein
MDPQFVKATIRCGISHKGTNIQINAATKKTKTK